jgi:4-hydroxybenzoate polyprenyltransferase
MPEPSETPAPEGGSVADAAQGNWVDRFAPAWSRPYLRLSRADRPIGTWLLFLPCAWGVSLAAAAGAPRMWDLWIVLGCAIGAFLMRGAGCTWNDINDREFDARVARTRSRPLPSGQVTVRQAYLWMAIQAGLAALILFTYNSTAVMLGIASLAFVAIYPFAKRFTWWPQVFLGLAFNWGALLAWGAHTGGLSAPPVILYASGIAWTLFYDTIYAHQDKDDDALIGVKSTARLFGERTRAWLFGFFAAAVVLMGLAVILALVPSGAGVPQLFLAMAGVWAFGWHLAWQLSRLDTENSAACLKIFRSNREAGLLPALFLAAAVFL